MSSFQAFRVASTIIEETADDTVSIYVYAQPFPGRPDNCDVRIFEFVTDVEGARKSARFQSFLKGCGVTHKIDEENELAGRYFSVRNKGLTATDFGALQDALTPAFVSAA